MTSPLQKGAKNTQSDTPFQVGVKPPISPGPPIALVSPKGARRWANGHPWIYRSDVVRRPDADAGATIVENGAGAPLGWALWSPRSEISLRLLDRSPNAQIDIAWWRARLQQAIARRAPLDEVATAFRLVHGEADGCPSLICDRYDRWLVVQLLSAGLERFRDDIVQSLIDLAEPQGIIARNDFRVRRRCCSATSRER